MSNKILISLFFIFSIVIVNADEQCNPNASKLFINNSTHNEIKVIGNDSSQKVKNVTIEPGEIKSVDITSLGTYSINIGGSSIWGFSTNYDKYDLSAPLNSSELNKVKLLWIKNSDNQFIAFSLHKSNLEDFDKKVVHALNTTDGEASFKCSNQLSDVSTSKGCQIISSDGWIPGEKFYLKFKD